MMKKIKLTKGYEATVDDDDYDRLAQHKWHVVCSRLAPYAVSRAHVMMHRMIANPPLGMLVDHINHDTLDNRKENLRVCTRSENCRNRKLGTPHTSRYKGVCYEKHGRKVWSAQITSNRKVIRIGRFESELDAAKAYDAKAKAIHGEFAVTNF